MRIFTLIRDLFEIPGIGGREWNPRGVSRWEAWRQLTNRQTALSGQETQRQSETSAGRKIPASTAAAAALTRSRAISTWLAAKVNSWRSTAKVSASTK